MLKADTMRLPPVFQGRLFSDDPDSTFSATPGTDNLHSRLAFPITDSTARIAPQRTRIDKEENKQKPRLSIEALYLPSYLSG
jgi:hypothetical protein